MYIRAIENNRVRHNRAFLFLYPPRTVLSGNRLHIQQGFSLKAVRSHSLYDLSIPRPPVFLGGFFTK